MMGYKLSSSDNCTLLATPVYINGTRSILKVSRERSDRLESGMRGEPFGYFVERYPTRPMRKVFPTEEEEAAMMESIGEGMIGCLALLSSKRL